MRPKFKSGAFQTYTKGRFSKYDGTQIGPTMEDGSFTYNNGSGSGTFDWSGFLNNLISGTSSVLTSVYGHNDQWQANAYNIMYEQEKRTNTILWVIIGLVVALGIVLIIRKK